MVEVIALAYLLNAIIENFGMKAPVQSRIRRILESRTYLHEQGYSNNAYGNDNVAMARNNDVRPHR
jgi:hypothetical protein